MLDGCYIVSYYVWVLERSEEEREEEILVDFGFYFISNIIIGLILILRMIRKLIFCLFVFVVLIVFFIEIEKREKKVRNEMLVN